jgi:hypothetical protein
MKYLISCIIFIFTLLAPCVFFVLLFEGNTLLVTFSLFSFAWALVYKNIHKVLLLLLKAREVIDTDHQELFQNIKTNVYQNFKKSPKVYLYDGSFKNCFLLESSGEWVIVLDRKLLEDMSSATIEDLITFLFEYHHTGKGFLKTKVLGLCVLFYNIFYWGLEKVLLLHPNSKIFKTLSFFIFMMARPLLAPMELFLSKERRVSASESLKPYFCQLFPLDPYTIFVSGHISQEVRIRDLLLEYMESYPLLAECEFD